jgi:hypothetical protein
VSPGDPRPPRDDQASEEDEENEGQMEDNRGVSEEVKSHDPSDWRDLLPRLNDCLASELTGRGGR